MSRYSPPFTPTHPSSFCGFQTVASPSQCGWLMDTDDIHHNVFRRYDDWREGGIDLTDIGSDCRVSNDNYHINNKNNNNQNSQNNQNKQNQGLGIRIPEIDDDIDDDDYGLIPPPPVQRFSREICSLTLERPSEHCPSAARETPCPSSFLGIRRTPPSVLEEQDEQILPPPPVKRTCRRNLCTNG